MRSHAYPLITILVVCFVASTVAAQEPEVSEFSRVSEEAQELLDALKDYGASQRDEAVAATRRALDNLDSNIQALERTMHDKWESMDQASREKAEETMRALRQERLELAEWYGAMKENSGDAWEEVKVGFSEAYQSLRDSWQRAKREVEGG